MAAISISIKDKTFGGDITNEITVFLERELTTVKDIIEARVYAEVAMHNSKLPEYFRGLVQPTDAERTLNGYKLKGVRKVDPEQQVFIALNAFQRNGFFVLIDNQQATALEQEVLVNPQTSISFIKITQLVGG